MIPLIPTVLSVFARQNLSMFIRHVSLLLLHIIFFHLKYHSRLRYHFSYITIILVSFQVYYITICIIWSCRQASKMLQSHTVSLLGLAATSYEGNPRTAKQRLGICRDLALGQGFLSIVWTLQACCGTFLSFFQFQHFPYFTSDLLSIKMWSSNKPTQTLQLSDSFTLQNLL